jgi:hypothetical protein
MERRMPGRKLQYPRRSDGGPRLEGKVKNKVRDGLEGEGQNRVYAISRCYNLEANVKAIDALSHGLGQ